MGGQNPPGVPISPAIDQEVVANGLGAPLRSCAELADVERLHGRGVRELAVLAVARE